MEPETKAKFIRRFSAGFCYLISIPLWGWLIPLSSNLGQYGKALDGALEYANETAVNASLFRAKYDEILAEENFKDSLILGAVVAVVTIPSYCPYVKTKIGNSFGWTKEKLVGCYRAMPSCRRSEADPDREHLISPNGSQ